MNRRFAWLTAFFVLAGFWGRIAPAQISSAKTLPQRSRSQTHRNTPLSPRERALHLLDRFTFGPQPGEVDAVMRMGWQEWFAQQLQPESLPDPVVQKRLAEYPALSLTPSQLLDEFPSNQRVRQIAEGLRPYSPDPTTAGLEQVLVAKYDQRKAANGNPVTAAPMQPGANSPQLVKTGQAMPPAAIEPVTEVADRVLAYSRGARMRAIMALPVDERILLAERIAGPQKSMLMADLTPHEREVFRAMSGGPDAVRIVDNELQQAKILRVILSQRQLQEVMTDFWFNHFNVFLNKDADQWYTPSYERDTIRPHALGKFSDLLLATAQDPAMLFFLDNWSSVGPDSAAGARPKGNGRQRRGVNENYGREVMELHTVSVNGGYTQADVTTLAKILTGWTIDQPQNGGGFLYAPRRHEPGSQQWFGHTVPAGGFEQGREALLWLAAQPQTAHFVSYELAQRFVADEPPPSLVAAMSKTYLATGGDIRQILLTMVHSPEFWSRRYYQAKVKTPLEFVASAFRATGTDPSNPEVLVNALHRMGEPLYQELPPTGYPMVASAWMNTGALVARLNFAMQLSGNRLGGMKLDDAQLLANALFSTPEPPRERAEQVSLSSSNESREQEDALVRMETVLLGQRASSRTESVLTHQLQEDTAGSYADRQVNSVQQLSDITALLLGSPEFQMR